MQAISNNLLNTLIDLISNKICYKFKIVDTISLLFALNLSKKVFNKLRLTKRKEANNTIILLGSIAHIYNTSYRDNLEISAITSRLF